MNEMVRFILTQEIAGNTVRSGVWNGRAFVIAADLAKGLGVPTQRVADYVRRNAGPGESELITAEEVRTRGFVAKAGGRPAFTIVFEGFVYEICLALGKSQKAVKFRKAIGKLIHNIYKEGHRITEQGELELQPQTAQVSMRPMDALVEWTKIVSTVLSDHEDRIVRLEKFDSGQMIGHARKANRRLKTLEAAVYPQQEKFDW